MQSYHLIDYFVAMKESAHFILRPFGLDDISNFAKHANNINIAKYMTNAFPHPYEESHATQFIQMVMEKESERILAIEVDGEACGGIGIHPQSDIHEKCAELGYWLSEMHWGKGILSRAVPQMIEKAFQLFPIVRLYARPFSNNPASARVLEKSGFIKEAVLQKSIYKNGEILDEWIYSILRP